MLVFECPCGVELAGDSDEELFRSARDHVERFHPGRRRSEAQLRRQIHIVRM